MIHPEQGSERSPNLYVQAALFRRGGRAKRAEIAIAEVMLSTGVDLAVFNLEDKSKHHRIVVLGVQPPIDVDIRIRQLLVKGSPTALSNQIIHDLEALRQVAIAEHTPSLN